MCKTCFQTKHYKILLSTLKKYIQLSLIARCIFLLQDFHPSNLYNTCFPPSKIQEWFSHHNNGHTGKIDLPPNLCYDYNCLGLVLYASFSTQGDLYASFRKHGDPDIILKNVASENPHFLYCHCQTSMANVDDETIACYTSKEEIMWLLNLGEFIWISYIPAALFRNMLHHCSHIEASFVSDWPGVIVQKCALRLLYKHDQVQFKKELKHCNDLILEQRELVRQQSEAYKKVVNEQNFERKTFKYNNIELEILLQTPSEPQVIIHRL